MAPGRRQRRQFTSGTDGRVRRGRPQEVTSAMGETEKLGLQAENLRRLASRWASAVAGTSYVPLRPTEIEELLLTFVRRLVNAAWRPSTDAKLTGVEVGAALVDAHFTDPLTLSQTVSVLLEHLPEVDDSVSGWTPGSVRTDDGGDASGVVVRWCRLIAGIGEGFSAALAERALCEQEQILGAAAEAQEHARQALQVSEERFRAVFQGAAIGIGIGDLDGRILEVNPALAHLLGYSAEELSRREVHEFMHPADLEYVWQLHGELVRGEREHFRLEKQFLRSTGESVWTDLTVSLLRDGCGRPCYQLALVHDVTALRQLRCQLEFEASHDPLTGLANRKMFLGHLNELFTSAAPGSRAGLCYLDLDGFKVVNDTLGHEAGDQLLIAIAQRLDNLVGARGPLVARLGGDEFVILVADSSDSAQLIALAEEILAAVAQ